MRYSKFRGRFSRRRNTAKRFNRRVNRILRGATASRIGRRY